MKKIHLVVFAILAFTLLFTGCPGPNDTELPTGKVEVKLSDDVAKLLADDEKIAVDIFLAAKDDLVVRNVELSKSQSSFTFKLTPGDYKVKVTKTTGFLVELNNSEFTVEVDKTNSLEVTKKKAGILNIKLSDESLEKLGDDKLLIKLKKEKTTININFNKNSVNIDYYIEPGEYSVEVTPSGNSILANCDNSSITVENDQKIELPIELVDAGMVQFESTSFTFPNISIMQDDNNVLEVTSAGSYKLPVGNYKLEISEDEDEMIKVVSDASDFSITKGQTETIKLDVQKYSSVQIVAAEDLISSLGNQSVKIIFTPKKGDSITFDFSKDSGKNLKLKEGKYTVAIESPTDGNVKYTILQSSINVVYGETASINLLFEKIAKFTLNVNDISKLADSKLLLTISQNDGKVKEIEITKDSKLEPIELKVGTYNINVDTEDAYLGVNLDNSEIVLDKDTTFNINVTQLGTVKITTTLNGLLGSKTVSLKLRDNNFNYEAIISENNLNPELKVPVGTYNIDLFNLDSNEISAEVNKTSAVVEYGKTFDITTTIYAGSFIEIGIDNKIPEDIEWDIYKKVDEKNAITELYVDGIPEAATVIWYDTKATINNGEINQYVGRSKEWSFLNDKIENIEVRVYINDVLVGAKKVDKKLWEDAK